MLGSEFQFRDKIPVGILGATGIPGQKLVELIAGHPWFTLAALWASDDTVGKLYKDVAGLNMPPQLLENIADIIVQPIKPGTPCSIVFSLLDSNRSHEVVNKFAEAGYVVISKAWEGIDAPLLVPDINSDHLEMIKGQKFRQGKIVAIPNSQAIGLSIVLKPLLDSFGLEAIQVDNLEPLSGVETEQVLAKYRDGRIERPSLKIRGLGDRVPASEDQKGRASVKLQRNASRAEILKAWDSYQGDAKLFQLPTAPEKLIYSLQENKPAVHNVWDKEMSVYVECLGENAQLDHTFNFWFNKTIRGDVGEAVLTAELMVRKGFIFW